MPSTAWPSCASNGSRQLRRVEAAETVAHTDTRFLYTIRPNALTTSGIRASSVRKASLFYFVFVMFSYTTGGPFGLESMVEKSGPGMALLYLLVLPFFWCIPVSLVSAELTTAMPVEGGFYRWTRAAFGDFWGFLAGWWNWSASFLLGGSYAVLFADYLGFYFPQITGWKHWLVSFALIAVITWVNVRGIESVGKAATAFEILIFIPVIALVVLGLAKWHHNPFLPFVPPNRPFVTVFGVGLALGLWLYSGYEQLSTVAEEVENPQRVFPRALAMVVPLSVAAYLLPTIATLAALGNWQDWKDGYFPTVAQLVGGPWLGNLMTIAAIVSTMALLNSTVLTTTRMPFALAEDGYLPPFLAAKHSRYGTPWVAILISAAIYASLAQHTLGQLISVYVWFRVSTTLLTVLSAWRLRKNRPDLPRAFRIPGGTLGLVYVVGLPIVMSCIVMYTLRYSDPISLRWGPWALATGPVVYVVTQWFAKRAARRTAAH